MQTVQGYTAAILLVVNAGTEHTGASACRNCMHIDRPADRLFRHDEHQVNCGRAPRHHTHTHTHAHYTYTTAHTIHRPASVQHHHINTHAMYHA